MSREDFVAIGTRLFAIYVALNLLLGAVRAAPMAFQDGVTAWSLSFVLAWVLTLLFCAALWVFPLTVARKLLPVMREPRSEQAIGASVALSLGLTLIGVWVLAFAVSSGIYWLTMILQVRELAATGYDWQPEQVANIVATLVEFVIGLWLIFGNAGLSRLLYRFRYGPLAPAEAERPAASRDDNG